MWDFFSTQVQNEVGQASHDRILHSSVYRDASRVEFSLVDDTSLKMLTIPSRWLEMMFFRSASY